MRMWWSILASHLSLLRSLPRYAVDDIACPFKSYPFKTLHSIAVHSIQYLCLLIQEQYRLIASPTALLHNTTSPRTHPFLATT